MVIPSWSLSLLVVMYNSIKTEAENIYDSAVAYVLKEPRRCWISCTADDRTLVPTIPHHRIRPENNIIKRDNNPQCTNWTLIISTGNKEAHIKAAFAGEADNRDHSTRHENQQLPSAFECRTHRSAYSSPTTPQHNTSQALACIPLAISDVAATSRSGGSLAQ